jgi:hypothetical protein
MYGTRFDAKQLPAETTLSLFFKIASLPDTTSTALNSSDTDLDQKALDG